MTSLERRAATTCGASPLPAPLPLLVDADTGWGGAFNIARTCARADQVPAPPGMHIEDQVAAKRCGHRPGKELVPPEEMVDRIKAAVDGAHRRQLRHHGAHRCARGRRPARRRSSARAAYVEAGADMIFPEAITTLDEYRAVRAARCRCRCSPTSPSSARRRCSRARSWRAAGVRLVLYPLSAFRAMNKARARGLRAPSAATARRRTWCDLMQTRAELYDVLGYHAYEQKLDELFGKDDSHELTRPATGSSRRNPSRCPASPPATPRCAPSAAPATTCTTAATTSSRSPTRASSRRSPTCWCTASCPTAPSSRPTRRSCKSLRGLAGRGAQRRSRRCPPPRIRWTCCAPACSALGCVLPEKDDHDAAGARDIADRLIASLRLDAAATGTTSAHNGQRIDVETDDDSIGGHFLHLLHGAPPPRILGARDAHLARSSTPSTSSTPRPSPRASSPAPAPTCTRASPARSARCAGPKHGGANEVGAARSSSATTRRTQAEADIRARVANKEVIIGFGHPVYTISDPRNQVIKEVARQLSQEAGDMKLLRHRRAHRDGDAGRQEDVPEPRLVLAPSPTT